MEKLWCRLYPEEHGGFVTFGDGGTCPECGTTGVPKEDL
jgi:hypothetical protein